MTLPDKEQYDPVFLHARREAIVIILLFSGFCAWSISVCLTQGYLESDESLATIDTTFGMPTWTFWGIFVPWLVVDVVAVWFCFFFMKADDLGDVHENEDLHEQLEHLKEKEEAHDD
jgi:hypothetical protein